MHLAARRRDVDMVRILVDYGTNVDTQNGEGQTPLHIAAAEGDEALLKYFYGVRASASIADNQGEILIELMLLFVKNILLNFNIKCSIQIEPPCIWLPRMVMLTS